MVGKKKTTLQLSNVALSLVEQESAFICIGAT